MFGIYRELQKINSNKTSNPVKKCTKNVNVILLKWWKLIDAFKKNAKIQ